MNPIVQALQSMGQGAFKSLIYDDEKKKLFPQSMMHKAAESGDIFRKYKAGQISREQYMDQANQDAMGIAMGMTGGIKAVGNPIKQALSSFLNKGVANSAPRIVPKIRPLEGIVKPAPPMHSSLDGFLKQQDLKSAPQIAKNIAPEDVPVLKAAVDRLESSYKAGQGNVNMDGYGKDSNIIKQIADRDIAQEGPGALESIKKAVESLGSKKFNSAAEALNDPAHMAKLKAARANRIPMKTETIPVSSLKPADEARFSQLTPDDVSLSGNQPIRAVKTENGNIVVDGHHRLRDAIQSGKKDMNVSFISKDQALKQFGGEIPDLKAKLFGGSDLAQEARKYKSADEFVKAQPKLFHSGTADIKEVNLGKSNFSKTFYLSDNADYAKSFGGKNSSINEMVLDTKAKLIDLRKPTEQQVSEISQAIQHEAGKPAKYGESFSLYPYSTTDVINGIKAGKAYFSELPQVKQILKGLGYDGQITAEVPYAKNIGIWNKDVVKTKSQLTDIWNKSKNSK